MRRLATTYAFLAATFHDFSLLSKTYARYRSLIADYALRVHSDPLAGCGPCGRPPLQGNQFPIRGADGHKGRALQMADTTHERPKVSPLSPHKAEGPSAVSASHTYHLCGSIISAALREKSYNQALVRKIRRFRVMRHNDFPLKTKPKNPLCRRQGLRSFALCGVRACERQSLSPPSPHKGQILLCRILALTQRKTLKTGSRGNSYLLTPIS